MKKKRLLLITLIVLLVLAVVFWILYPHKTKAPAADNTTKSSVAVAQPAGFDKTQYSIDTPDSPWWIVSRKRPLPDGYVPPDLVTPTVTLNNTKSASENTLRKDTATAVEKLFASAKAAGLSYMLASGYRSKALQTSVYNSYVAQYGVAKADTFSARPGTSEHQTGMALDVSRTDRKLYLDQAFGNDPAGQWLAAHSYEYGFIVRYPEGKDAITGYEYEPWHIRYVGIPLATELHKTGQTMEEFFGLN